MQMKVEIVTHCWNYSRLLSYHLGSLAIVTPRILVTASIYYSPGDLRTERVLTHYAAIRVPNVTWNWRVIEESRLFRRAIGRNISALETTADWIWFCDVDLCFRENCLDSCGKALAACNAPLAFPRHVYQSRSHADGDRMIATMPEGGAIRDIDPTLFERRRIPRATGAFQICRGDVARKLGYCRDMPRYQRPEKRWQRTTEDVAFRRTIGERGVPIDVEGLYRIRHSERGRESHVLL